MSNTSIIKEIRKKLADGMAVEKVIDFIDGVLAAMSSYEDAFPSPSSPSISPLMPAIPNPVPIPNAPAMPGEPWYLSRSAQLINGTSSMPNHPDNPAINPLGPVVTDTTIE